jgi:hypothetical protein
MREVKNNGEVYRLPSILNPFQEEMYIHIIDWKWKHINREPGYYKNEPYDAILPESVKEDFPVIYPDIVNALKKHHEKFYFKLHQHFNHMASSQAANANLFLPVLLHPRANDVLRLIKPNDFYELATGELDHGFQIEFWGPREGSGLLGDHTKLYGTDSDIAIAYFNNNHELCLWLIEHKLTEQEFTECHGSTSSGKKPQHDCSKSFSDIINNKNYCYYHNIRQFRYWDITERHQDFFANHDKYAQCPFRSGTNQLWRNQLLALRLEDHAWPYKHVFFSVVRHPLNTSLDKTINDYKKLTADNSKFSVFTSKDVIKAAESLDDSKLNMWATWYRELYNL